MKFVVDEMPRTSEECMFSEYRDHHDLWTCSFKHYVPERGKRVVCVCHPTTCDRLITLEEALKKGDKHDL